MLLLAAFLVVAIGLAHSFLGERYILTRLFRQPLPRLFGGDRFTKQTVRFAWHITTIAWFGFAALLFLLYIDHATRSSLLIAIGSTFGLTALVTLVASRAKHLSWLVFGAISIICFVFAWQEIQEFLAIDACLDSGGRFNYQMHVCDSEVSRPAGQNGSS